MTEKKQTRDMGIGPSTKKLKSMLKILSEHGVLKYKDSEFEIELAEISGSETLLHLKKGDSKVIALIEEVMNFKIHGKVKIKFNENKLYAFDQNEELVSSPYGVSHG